MVRITAYHVSQETRLTAIDRRVCDDENRDGLLYGANVACFTTTLYNGQLPTRSPYPRDFEEGRSGYRYTKRFNPARFDKFLMAETTYDGATQVHYLLLKKSRSDERIVAALVRKCVPARENQDWDTYFPHGRANDYSTRAEDHVGRVFVNVMFWHDVRGVREVDTVPKRGETFTMEPVVEVGVWLKNLLQEATDNADSDGDDDGLTGLMGRATLNDNRP